MIKYKWDVALRSHWRMQEPEWVQVELGESVELYKAREADSEIAELKDRIAEIESSEQDNCEIIGQHETREDTDAAEISKLRSVISEQDERISEIAFNCPSCGRHDFGFWQDSVKLMHSNDLLKAALRWALENGARKDEFGLYCSAVNVLDDLTPPPEFAPLIAEAAKND